MDEQVFFKLLREWSTHAVGVGARQAAGDFAKRYTQYSHLQNKMEQYLHYQELANEVSMDLHQEMVKGE